MKTGTDTLEASSSITADGEVWQILFSRQMALLKQSGYQEFLTGVDRIGFTESEVPSFDEVNQRLKTLNGWTVIPTTGICPPEEFFKLLSEKRFVCNSWLRPIESLDYIVEPDLFHDFFGHVPMLTSESLCQFFKALGDIAVKYGEYPGVIDKIERLYWFTVEFGLIKVNGNLKVYGAGIASSYTETLQALGENSRKHVYDVKKIMHHPFRTDVKQEDYYVINNIEELIDSIPEIFEVIEDEV